MPELSKVHTHRTGRQVLKFAQDGIRIKPSLVEKAYAELAYQGINIPIRWIRQAISGLEAAHGGMDALDGIPPLGANITTPSVTTPLQFLQAWLPGFISVVTKARNIDLLTGVTTVGSWEDEEVVFGITEPQGYAVPYTDWGNVPYAQYNTEFERRTIVRFEQGLYVGTLEEARAARINISVAAQKRAAATLQLQIARNRIGFVGMNAGQNRTYGFLNDPSLQPYITAPAGEGGSTLWSGKTFLEICNDIRTLAAQLQVDSGDVISVDRDQTVLAIGTGNVQYLSVMNVQGTQSVKQWLRETYPLMRVASAPELDKANGGANVAYLYAEKVDDGGMSTDDSAVWLQPVPAQFVALGVERQSKKYVEDFTNATAGVIVKRPFAVKRMTGV